MFNVLPGREKPSLDLTMFRQSQSWRMCWPKKLQNARSTWTFPMVSGLWPQYWRLHIYYKIISFWVGLVHRFKWGVCGSHTKPHPSQAGVPTAVGQESTAHWCSQGNLLCVISCACIFTLVVQTDFCSVHVCSLCMH